MLAARRHEKQKVSTNPKSAAKVDGAGGVVAGDAKVDGARGDVTDDDTVAMAGGAANNTAVRQSHIINHNTM